LHSFARSSENATIEEMQSSSGFSWPRRRKCLLPTMASIMLLMILFFSLMEKIAFFLMNVYTL
jgi:hypothetical protein